MHGMAIHPCDKKIEKRALDGIISADELGSTILNVIKAYHVYIHAPC